MKIWTTLLLFLLTFTNLYAQSYKDTQVKNKIIVGLGTTLNHTRFYQGNNGLYKELTLDYGVGNFFSAGLYVGYQQREYTFLSAPAQNTSQVFQYSQTFMPAGLRLNIHLTSFLINQLGVKINADKFDLYVTYFAGAVFNSVENQFPSTNGPNNVIDYANYRTNEDVQYNAGLLTGLKYSPVKDFGVFVEGGLGIMGNVNIGVFARF